MNECMSHMFEVHSSVSQHDMQSFQKCLQHIQDLKAIGNSRYHNKNID